MLPDAPYFIILPCLTPDDFTRPGESTATQWVNRYGLMFCTIYLSLKVDVRGRCGALISRNKNRTKPYLEINFRHKFSLLVVSIMSRYSSAHKVGFKPELLRIDFVRFSMSGTILCDEQMSMCS